MSAQAMAWESSASSVTTGWSGETKEEIRIQEVEEEQIGGDRKRRGGYGWEDSYMKSPKV